MAQGISIQPIVPPFLKWAGGKRWLTENHQDLLNVNFDRFVEPFLGSGAVFFRLHPSSAILSDKNKDLINTYLAIKEDWQSVFHHLKNHQEFHCKEYYYKIRGQAPLSLASMAAQFIYLNRTCWNGLYRVNLKGQFNVPIGTKTNVILDTDDFEQVSKLLRTAEIRLSDFEDIVDETGNGDFVFLDPPYTVKHNHNGFIKYNEGLFSWDDQIRLRDAVQRAIKRGAKVLITNASHECVQDLYKGIGSFIALSRPSVISGKVSGRGTCEEIVIKCY